ncbi:MFS transporter [Rhodococcus opacus]|uniref:Putative proline/betaine transporter n=2 Tax=Rhodococcus opacus TaxID=37919 RepID=A0A1B1KAV4_RHOOP|nr:MULTISPECIES: MFS transporter [Rhodococcus]ELB90445.1 alpha-ketoglutarate transporter [Rhodococcus wratislaviensis IFP 2016]NHU47915.1 MFS transporter [Rhodococcus sp. A14]ANS29757.1 alpha-ketoglutarate transporter [Rhodococcus opacus]EID73959.1 alpha-ketoglutarate transporter [Rhodococcus opacus RKJ300 = JCM 13270]MBA8964804.1 MHS family alpha-ketoglutarate permease-like MFS transporter [Rhodococcus opacus]
MNVDLTRQAQPDTHSGPTLASRKKSLLASSVGNVLEWYEWSAYAVFAPFIAAAMFSNSDPVSALLSTLAVFAVGFLMRPLGGIIFGRIADKRGRKFVLVTTMLMMATGSLIIGVMPTYSTIGAWASLILLAARVMQGFAHGGESATAYSYVGEIAPPHRRGMWGSVAFIAIFGGSVLAYTVGGVVTSSLSDTAVGQWGWRIPFLIGALLALFALYLRRSMEESDVFDAAQNNDDLPSIPRRAVVRAILLMIGMTSGITAAHYTWTSYISTYAITQQGMNPDTAYWMLVIAQLIALVSLPFLGLLSDKIGRRPMLGAFAVLMFALQLPLTMMITSDGWTLLVATTAALLIVAVPASILSSTLSESFPTRLRTQAIGFAYSFSVAVFGGTAPYLNQLLLGLDLGWVFGVYIMVLAVLTGVACLFMKETKGIRLEDV